MQVTLDFENYAKHEDEVFCHGCKHMERDWFSYYSHIGDFSDKYTPICNLREDEVNCYLVKSCNMYEVESDY